MRGLGCFFYQMPIRSGKLAQSGAPPDRLPALMEHQRGVPRGRRVLYTAIRRGVEIVRFETLDEFG